MGTTGELNLGCGLTTEASSTRDKADRLDGVLPDRTSILLIGRGPCHTLSFPFRNFEKDTVRLNHFPSNRVREWVIRSVSELEESVWFARLSESLFESLLTTQSSDCFWNRGRLYVSGVLDGIDPDWWYLNLRRGRGGCGR